MVAGTGRLYRPELFEPLVDASWDEGRVRDAIAAIVRDVERAYRGPERLWPADPMPAQDGSDTPDPVKSLYQGAAGTLYALDDLQRRGYAETSLDVPVLALRVLEAYEREPDFRRSVDVPQPGDAALLMGEPGILLLAWRLAGDAERGALGDRLERRIRENLDNVAGDVMWGTPGTLLAANTMLGWTDEERWRALAQQSAEAILGRRDADGLWTQRLYGDEVRRLDPIHGAAGNLLALTGAAQREVRQGIERDAAGLFARLAVIEDGLANWPVAAGEAPGLLRWCAGAPGIVAAASAYLDEDLVLAAAELTWLAGAPRISQGPGICCGTSGNGYALLKVFERTSDERWLGRARRFAMHALAQVERDRGRAASGWFSLWKGDPGVALFAADALRARARYPIFDND